MPRKLSGPTGLLDDLFGRQVGGVGFLSHLRSLGATMSQKSSLPQAAKSVSRVLVSDRWGSVVRFLNLALRDVEALDVFLDVGVQLT